MYMDTNTPSSKLHQSATSYAILREDGEGPPARSFDARPKAIVDLERRRNDFFERRGLQEARVTEQITLEQEGASISSQEKQRIELSLG